MTPQLQKIESYLSNRFSQTVTVDGIEELGGSARGAAALKAFGYGRPLRIRFHCAGQPRDVVLRQIKRNGFGRERDSDRIAEVWLDHHTFSHLPRHTQALDMVGQTGTGDLVSLGNVQDMLLLTDFVTGTPYADDLARIRDEGATGALDIARSQALACYLAQIHNVRCDDPLLWRRRLRDLIGHGEGVMGLADSYPSDFGLAGADFLRAIECAVNDWRWRLKPLHHRLCQVHGDFHPFNVIFKTATDFHLLDRSRGEWGEAADDVSCMSINYLFFSLQRADDLCEPFSGLHAAFWESYLTAHPDDELLHVIQPWLAWRALVLASPLWYPHLRDETRRRLLALARNVLHVEQYDWRNVNALLEGGSLV